MVMHSDPDGRSEFHPRSEIGQEDGQSEVETTYTPKPNILAGIWPTDVMVQCRNEDPFRATIKFSPGIMEIPAPFISCPHCARDYSLNAEGEWYADRPLVILKGGDRQAW